MPVATRGRGGAGLGAAVTEAAPSRGGAEVILGAAAVIVEDVVGLVGLAEAAGGVRAGGGVGLGVAVGVVEEGEAGECGLDLGFAGISPEPQRPVVVGLAHRGRGSELAFPSLQDRDGGFVTVLSGCVLLYFSV